MTDFHLYTYGGGRILHELLNILAIIFQSHNPYMTSVLGFTAIIGAIWAMTRAAFQSNIGVFAKSWFIPTLLLINVFLLPKATVHIRDTVDQDFHYAAVSNIPAGVALVVCLPSFIGHSLATEIDDKMSGGMDSKKYTISGPLFGARVAAAARELTIRDMTMRQNIKNFVGQCFMLPYVFTNISPGREEALKSTNILEFITKNPHPSLGAYWKERDGKEEFLDCKECAVNVSNALGMEIKSSTLSEFASLVSGSLTSRPQNQQTKLISYFEDAWKAVAKESAGLQEVMNQSLLINAYRERFDDKREEFGVQRLDPSLLKVSAARASMQQNASSLTKFILISEHLPKLHSIIIALSMMLFILILPLTFLPGGIGYLGMWIQLNIWVHTWPIFFAILNGISNIFLEYSSGNWVGLTLPSQSGMADYSHDAYCWTLGLMASIPPLSWALISKSSYMLGQQFSGISESLMASGARLATDAVDGNVSFDNSSIGNKTLFGTQIAQQTLGSNVNYGRSVDSGTLKMTHGDAGDVIGNAPGSALQVSANVGEGETNSVQTQLTNSSQMTAQKMLAFANHMAHATGTSEGSTINDSVEKRQAAENFKNSAENFARANNMTLEGAIQAGLSFGLGGGSGGGKGFGFSASANVSAKDATTLSKAFNTNEGQNFAKSMNEMMNISKQDSATSSDTNTRDMAQSLQNQYADMKSLAKIESQSKENRWGLQSNKTDDVLEYVANTQFGGDKEQAIMYAHKNPEAFSQSVKESLSFTDPSVQERFRPESHGIASDHVGNFTQESISKGIQSEQTIIENASSTQAHSEELMKQMVQNTRDINRNIEKQIDTRKKEYEDWNVTGKAGNYLANKAKNLFKRKD